MGHISRWGTGKMGMGNFCINQKFLKATKQATATESSIIGQIFLGVGWLSESNHRKAFRLDVPVLRHWHYNTATLRHQCWCCNTTTLNTTLRHWCKNPLIHLIMTWNAFKNFDTTKTANLATWRAPDRQIGDFWARNTSDDVKMQFQK